ncbi:MAG: DJ-1/PfpI family protein [Anaerolineaceae bacterium]|nr:DJ-1/PfpI family protein [Anaerolineaceae bacterium]MCB9097993.1 DJ-1/PfpI family protein [Anaerolineales bacterium]
MSRSDATILVLWADGFQEATATIFVTELRRTGVRVKIIGSTRQQIKGSYGLAIAPDLTLSQADSLLPQTTRLIIPTTLSAVGRLKNDPNLTAFLEQIEHYQIPILIGGQATEPPMFLKSTITIFPADSEALVGFARQVAGGNP